MRYIRWLVMCGLLLAAGLWALALGIVGIAVIAVGGTAGAAAGAALLAIATTPTVIIMGARMTRRSGSRRSKAGNRRKANAAYVQAMTREGIDDDIDFLITEWPR
ncbi:MAG: hypothetical protein ABR507_09865 [Actinomycetota bacterium]|nr:hypothetical protein [Actinomycetota bacterium]